MKINVNIVTTGEEIINEYFIPSAQKAGQTVPKEKIKILVFSDKAGKEVEIAPDKLKIVFNE